MEREQKIIFSLGCACGSRGCRTAHPQDTLSTLKSPKTSHRLPLPASCAVYFVHQWSTFRASKLSSIVCECYCHASCCTVWCGAICAMTDYGCHPKSSWPCQSRGYRASHTTHVLVSWICLAWQCQLLISMAHPTCSLQSAVVCIMCLTSSADSPAPSRQLCSTATAVKAGRP